DYEYVQSEPDINRPFQVAHVGKWNLTENLQIYDPKINYESGSKTLNHYLCDFDELLSCMILDENENSFTIRYGIFIVNDKVHISERYPSTRNVVMGKQTQFYGSGETILNKTDRAMIAAHTDTIETILKILTITESDRKGSRYKSELYKCKYLYYFNDNECKYKEKRVIKNDQNND
ncbi:24977_t:CDS:2, partial [Racocetra persica]